MDFKMTKYGFIYVWYDTYKKMFYIGSHWGHENDGYICSSRWMLKAYQNRPNDFKRRIVKRIFTDRVDLLIEEQRWMDMINELHTIRFNHTDESRNDNVKYYNINLKVHKNVWHAYADNIKTIGQKISESKKGKTTRPCSEETKLKISLSNIGKIRSVETRLAISKAKLASEKKHTEEWKRENSIRLKKQHASGTRKIVADKNTGKKRSVEQRKNLSNSMKGIPKSENHKRKISENSLARSEEISSGLKSRWADPIWAANQRKRLSEGAKNRPPRGNKSTIQKDKNPL